MRGRSGLFAGAMTKKLCVIFLTLAFAQGASAGGGPGPSGGGGGGGGGSTSGKRADDVSSTVSFPSTNITSVIDDSRVRAAIIPTFAVPALAPAALPGAAASLPAMQLPFANLESRRGGGVGALQRVRGGPVRVSGGPGRNGRDGVGDGGSEIEPGDARSSSGEIELGGFGGLDGRKAYDLAAQLPVASPFAPWKTAAPDFVPACE